MSEKQPPEREVGFARPPRHTQFRKGTSGNPKGRPRGSKSLSTLLEETLGEKVVVSENGRRRMITKRAAVIKQLVNKAASGDPRATRHLIDLDLRVNPGSVRPPNAIDVLREAFDRAEKRKAQMVAEPAVPSELENVDERVSGSSRSFTKNV